MTRARDVLVNLYRAPFRRQRGESYAYRAALGQVAGTLAWRDAQQDRRLRAGAEYTLRAGDGVGTVTLRAGTSDRLVFEQLFLQRELAFEVLPEPAVIIDAVANIGLATRWFAARWPRARIVAVEVDAGNVAMLRRNVAELANVEVVHGALWGTDGHVRIVNPADAPWSFRVEGCVASEPGAVAAWTVARLMREFGLERIDLFKCDIEGGELDVLTADLAWLDRTRVFALELHDRFRPGCTGALDAAIAARAHTRSRSGEYEIVRFG